MDTINRLQFRHHDEIFTGATLDEARAAAIGYISGATAEIRNATTGLAVSDDNNFGVGTKYGYSLFSEPTILRYSTPGSAETDPHIILAIGSVTNDKYNETGELWHSNNKFCIIDIDKTEGEIEDLREEIEKIIKSLNIITIDSDSLDLESEWVVGEGIYLSGDVKTTDHHAFSASGGSKPNSLMIASANTDTGSEGLFIYVDLKYDESTETFTFYTSLFDGTLKEVPVKLPNNYLVSGEYKKEDESIHLHMKNGDEVLIDCEQLIDEWKVEGDASMTPIVLTREEVGPDEDHHHTEPWQDILRGDVRIADFIGTNILKKTSDGRYLYVDGKATNIIYYYNGELSNVSEQLDKLNKIKISADNDNIIWNRTDGFFATSKLEYISNKNKLVFTTSNVSGGTVSKEIQLNSVELFQNVYYDRNTEELVITYKDNEGNLKVIRIPISDMFDEWDVLNDAHSVKLVKSPHHVSGKDILTADVNISSMENNILKEMGEGNVHALFVKGTSDNIKYNDTTVEGALDDLAAKDAAINEKLDQEIERSTAEDEKIENTIGSGFSTDAHETVTYKFDQLQEQVNSEAENLQNEIDRSTAKDDEHDERLDAIDAEIGEGFNPRNTVRDEIDNLHSEIDAVSADTSMRLTDVINEDESIDVETRNDAAGKPTVKVVKVNLSTEVEDDRKNIIKLNSDGLFANVDLSYVKEANKLIFHASNGEPDKEIQLESMSSIIDIRYDAAKEAIIITYMTNGHEIKTVEIPVGDLINEWRVEDGHPHAVQLEKVRIASGTTEQDVLKASVIITDDHDDNILVMDDGALYVPANTNVTEALREAIEAEIIRASEAESVLNNAITTEELRATSAETALQTAIENEKGRAMNAESELNTTLTSKIEQTATALSAYTRTAVNEEQTRAMTVEGELRQAIQDETARANAADQLLQDAIDDEVARSTAKDDEHDLKISALETSAVTLSSEINAERVRATSAETSLSTAINNETTRAINAENTLNTNLTSRISETATNLSAYTRTAVNEEQTRAMTAEGELRTAIVAETERANAADTVLSGNIQTVAESVSREEARARQAEADIQGNIDDNKIEFEDTTSINFDSHQPTVGVGSVITAEVKLHDADDNLIKCGQGLYATARLDYNSGTNKIKLITSAGEQEFQLSAGAIIDNIYFDENTGELVITYHNAEGSQTVKFGVSELFNPWIVQNPSSGSAIELVKTPAESQGDPDELSARVLLTNLDDNAVKIVNNGLYVSSSAMTGAEEIAKCAKAELKGVEKAVIGHTIADCDSGYTYEPWTIANYISGATSFNNADFILDQSIKNVENKVDDVIEDVNCVDSSAKKLYELLYGQGTSMPDCGEGVVYTPDLGSCVISAATSFMDADKKLGDQICEILEMWVSGMTCTSLTDWVDEGANKKMLVDVRLSHGNGAAMSDDDLTTVDLNGVYIDPTYTEFTDTNALRIVCLQEGGGGVIPDVKSKQNGIYLSNVWDCGLYYGPGDTEAKTKAEEAGYNTNYSTDEDASASSFNYMNNVRQSDTLC